MGHPIADANRGYNHENVNRFTTLQVSSPIALFDGAGTTPIPIKNEETQTKTQTTENLNRQNSKVLSICREKETQTMVRAALKGTNLRGQTPICGFLRVPAVFCGFLRKSAVFCEICVSQMLRFLGRGENLQKSVKISENLRLGSVCPLRFVPLSAP